jgi:HEAT repeats
MRKRGRIIVAALVLAVAGGLVARAMLRPPTGPPDLVYGGHPLSQWLAGDFSTSPALDSNAVPFLVHSLKQRDGALLKAYGSLLDADLPDWLQKRLPIPKFAWMVRFNSCQFLNRLGASARPAIPELIRVMTEDEDGAVRAVAAGALGNIANHEDKPVIDALAGATKDKDATVARRAGEALSGIDPQAAAKAGVASSANVLNNLPAR